MPSTEGVRLQKVLARAGFGSRRTCDDLIAEGRVTVNGEVAVLGRRVDPEADHVEVDRCPAVDPCGSRLLPAEQADRAWSPRPTIRRVDPRSSSSFPTSLGSFPVGRLDIDTEGLLLLTNDGDLTHRLTHPSFGVEKEYLASVAGEPTPGEVRQLREGVQLDDGVTAPAKANVVSPGVVRLAIHEGRNRQVRRMCDAIGHPGASSGAHPHRSADRSLA